mmetsp:Transcript_8195/g.18337  ORF Transcript_8195/g.18337 Transcript_8195/m.18337 type:complete len:523 (-) Transcript_8195:52-1620(-)
MTRLVWNGALQGVIFAACCGLVFGSNKALLTVERSSGSSSRRKTQYMPALYAEWSIDAKMESGTLMHYKDNADGCKSLRRCPSCALLVIQGNCTFARKARVAQDAGYSMLLVASAKERETVSMIDAPARFGLRLRGPSSIPAVMLPKVFGDKLVKALARGDSFAIKMEPNNRFIEDLFGEAVMGLIAVGLVIAGALYSCEDLHHSAQGSQSAGAEFEEVQPVEAYAGFTFLVYGSIMLTLLYFFMKYGIYVLIFFFVTGAVSSTVALLEPVVARMCPGLRTKKAFRLPARVSSITGIEQDHACSDAVAEAIACSLAVVFLLNRNNDEIGWIVQDIFGVALLLIIQKTVRFPNLKVATIFLVCTFFFDIFWVFISPRIFGKSVMVEVATGGGTGQSVPLVLKIPDAYGSFKILGYGDIAIPGLLISLLRRHDLTSKYSLCSGYFAYGVVGYALGLVATFISLFLMKHGQPALLFLVPGILMPTFLIASCKGELLAFWQASYGPSTEAESEGYKPLAGGADKEA